MSNRPSAPNPFRPVRSLLFACLPFFVPAGWAADYSWTSAIDGDWGDPAGWGPVAGVPNGAGDTAAILVAGSGSYFVTLDGDYAIDAFTHGSPDAVLLATGRTFTVNGPTSFSGRQISFGGSTYVSNGTFTHSSGILDLSTSNLTGTGDYVKTGGTTKLANSGLLVPATQEGGAITLSAACVFGGGFTNAGGSLGLDPGVTLALANGDLRNGGTLELAGGAAVTKIESATGSRLVNLGTGTCTIRAGGTAARTIAAGVENHGAFVLERAATWNAVAGAHSNTGKITATGQLLVQDARSFANSGEVLSTGGNLSFSGDASAGSLFDNSGTITVGNGLLLQLFKSATNSGTIAVNQGTATIRTVNNGEVHAFAHSGTITVAAGASLAFASTGSGTGQVVLGHEAVLGGGGAVSFTNQAVELQGAWSPGVSPVTTSTVSFGGAGSLTVAAGSTLQATRTQFGVATVNFGSVAVNSSNNTVQGGFTNETGATVTLAGGASLLLHDADFINAGNFVYAVGAGTTRVGNLETGSTGVFRNAAGGTVTVGGGGVRRLSTHSANAGVIAINAALLLDRAAGAHVNDGTVNASGDWQVQSARSFANSGAVTSSGGNLSFVGDTNAASVFSNSGTITARNGFLLHSFKAASNSGTLAITAGAATIRTAINSGLYPFENSGTITVAPGASLAFDFSGTGTGVVILRDAATLGGGGAVSFVNQAVELQGAWSAGASQVTASATTFSGAGALAVDEGGTLAATACNFALPTANRGSVTLQASSTTAHGGFTNEATGLSTLAAGVTLRLHDADFINRGQLRFGAGDATTQITQFQTTASVGVFRNEAGGEVTVDGPGPRRILTNTINQGTLTLTGGLALERGAGVHANPGTITAGGPLLVQNARGFDNAGTVTSGGGSLSFVGDANAASAFSNSGTITARNGLLLQSFKAAANSGTLTIAEGAATIRTAINSALYPFENSGTITVAPGASLAFDFSGTGTGVVTLRDGATLGGGGAVSFVNQAVELQGAWSPGSSPLTASATTFSGAGALAVDEGGTLAATACNFALPTTNRGSVTLQASTTSAHGGFTNEATGVATLDAGVTLRLHDADFTNRGRLRFGAGEAATQITQFQTTSSVGVFRNEAGGEVAVDGPGLRRVLTNTINQGTLTLAGGLGLERGAGVHTNAGTITAGGPLLVQNARGFDNSGTVTSGGGALTFAGDASSSSVFANGGTITAANGLVLERFRTSSNSGTLAISQGAATIVTGLNSIAHPFANSGTLRIAAGAALNFAMSGIGTGQATNEPTGRITGSGALTVTATQFTNRGTIAPGDSIGTLTIGTMSHTSEAAFEIEVDATTADRLEVAGDLALAGTLRVRPTPGYVPAPTDGWVIMRCTGVLSGSFAGIEQPFPELGLFEASVDQGAREVWLSFVQHAPLSYEDFQSAYFTPEQIAAGLAAPDHDFDQDGLENFLEWIHGLDPTSTHWPVAPLRIVHADGQVRLVFLKSKLLPANVTMEVLTATNPADGFTPIPAGEVVQLAEQPVPRFPNTAEVTLGFSNPAWAADPARFFKLRFTASEP